MFKINRLYTILFILAFFSCQSKAGEKAIANSGILTTMSFKDEIHIFGNIKNNNEVTAIFNFVNSGNQPLVISKVKTSCGCTVPEYPKDIIKPNEIGEIKVIYDAKYPGRFNKTITVFYNGKDSPKTLTVKGEVTYPEDLDSINN